MRASMIAILAVLTGCSTTIPAEGPDKLPAAAGAAVPVSNVGRNGDLIGVVDGSRTEPTQISVWSERALGEMRLALFDVHSQDGTDIGRFSLCTPYKVCSVEDSELSDRECREDPFGETECRFVAPSGIEYQVKRFSPEITVGEITTSAALWEATS